MSVVNEIKVEPEVVVPLSAMLEEPNLPEELNDDDTVKTTADEETKTDIVIDKAEEKLETKIEEAKNDGATNSEINELRALLRELRNDNISLKTRLSAAERVQKGDFGTDGKEEELTELETYQLQLQNASTRDFSSILAVMEVNPKYEDLSTVCTASNFEDIFERVARYRSDENTTDFTVELIKVKAEVWSMPNPYKYMYEVIKEYHPNYIKKGDTKAAEKTDEKLTAKEVLDKQKKVVTAPASVATLGGGDETKGGWTAEKIDNMPESKLHEVPRDIYKKWLAGELD